MTLTLVSPLRGWVCSLAELPDAAFAQGMVGDGVAIDPTGDTLHAPCAGIVVGVHRARHAVTLRAENGAELLCHIGIETVGLGGDGFTVLVADGDRVAVGAPLIRFDLDILANDAKSLASPILLIDPDAYRITRRAQDLRVAVGDWLMEVAATGATTTAASATDTPASTRTITLPPGHGIHARPAAAIAACARGFDAVVELVTTRTRASATSPVALMTLGVAAGETVTLSAHGRDADAALTALARLIEHGLETGARTPHAPPPAPARNGGTTAVPGIALGTIVHVATLRREPPATGQGRAAETQALDAALASVRAALATRTASGPAAQRDIARAHLELLDDP
uniref:glucose PTS transporter subunit IIA n=1 Tax=uncultured Sphingomonas sp. TaxID=158754 RepID=UPI0035CC7017